MSSPLLRCSSKPASTEAAPFVGQDQGKSSSPAGAGVGLVGGRLATGGSVGAAAAEPPGRGALAPAAGAPVLGAMVLGATGRATATSVVVPAGGITRSTCPTSITLGLSM